MSGLAEFACCGRGWWLHWYALPFEMGVDQPSEAGFTGASDAEVLRELRYVWESNSVSDSEGSESDSSESSWDCSDDESLSSSGRDPGT